MTTPLLDGMRVLDAGIWRPVPHATQMLADLGADVCKLEPPGGDPMRAFPHLFRDIASHKTSVVVDLRTDAGQRTRARARGRATKCSARAGDRVSPTASVSGTRRCGR